jgi:hypothetical protein
MPAVRLIGIGVAGLSDAKAEHIQADLFAADASDRSLQVDALTDAVNTRFGPSTLQRGRSKTRNTE